MTKPRDISKQDNDLQYTIDPQYHVNLIGYPDLELPSDYYFQKMRECSNYFAFKRMYGYIYTRRAFIKPKMIPGKIDMDDEFKQKLDDVILPIARKLVDEYKRNPSKALAHVRYYLKAHKPFVI